MAKATMLKILRHPALVHLLAAGVVVLLPPLLLEEPVWRLQRTVKICLLLASAVYLTSALALTLHRPVTSRFPRAMSVLTAGLIFAPAALLLLIVPAGAARQVLLGALGLAFALIVIA